VKTSTFGNSKVDIVLAEHLSLHPEMAKWACHAINKTTSLLYQLKRIQAPRKFVLKMFGYIRQDVLNYVSSPPPHMHTKTKTFTANVVMRHLRNYMRTR